MTGEINTVGINNKQSSFAGVSMMMMMMMKMIQLTMLPYVSRCSDIFT